MDIVVQKRIYNILLLILCSLASVCLMGYIDEITLNTYLHRIFVWCYFVMLLYLLAFLMRKKTIHFIRKYKVFCTSVMLIIAFWSLLFGKNFIPKNMVNNQIQLSILENKNPESEGREVWLKKIILDGKEEPLELYVDNDSGWLLVENAICGQYDNTGDLVLILPSARQIKLEFGRHIWSGIVQVKAQGTVQEYDLYDSLGSDFDIILFGESVQYEGIMYYILIAGCFSMCLIIAGYICIFFFYKTSKEK